MSDLDAIRDRITAAGHAVLGPKWKSTLESSAPGRIEILGGHLDYNGGPVLAAAIDKRILIRAAPNGTSTIRAVFADFDPEALHEIDLRSVGDWRTETGAQSPADFLRGLVAALRSHRIRVKDGVDMVVAGNLPHGVGISSSAALCVALIGALTDKRLSRSEKVLIAQEGENRTGSPCGTMDQSASVFGDIIYFNGADNSVTELRANLENHMFLVANSGVVRSLATSVYPMRVRESKDAVALLQDRYRSDLESITDLTLEERDAALESISDQPVLASRVRHVVDETIRTIAGRILTDTYEWEGFGELMTASGRSASDDYGIGHPVVDELTAAALEHPSVLGARIMGGGEGGAALLLIVDYDLDDIRRHLDRNFYAPKGYDVDAMLVPCTIAHGASVTKM